MAEIDDLLGDKSDRLENVPKEFVESISKLEPRIASEVESLLSELEMQNGNILLTERNMAIIENVNQRLKNIIFDEVYEKNLTKFIGEFKGQAKLANEYFQVLDPEFSITPVYESVLRSTQRNAIELLNEDAFTQALITPIKQTLESSITNNISFTDTLKGLREIIIGKEGEYDGRMMSHVKRVAYDSFAASDRAYTNTIATDLGLEFYRYSGGEIETTRCFCDERNRKYFHKKEIEGWGEGKNVGSCGFPWAGMNENTDKATIFIYAGGYNCRHSILPVSKKSVPRYVIERNIRNGNYKERN
jgi:hypothetical protein